MKNLTLIIDIGNTTTIFGVFNKDIFLNSLITLTYKNTEEDKQKKFTKFLYDNDFEVSKGMIFSVVPNESLKIKKLIENSLDINLEIFDAKNYKGITANVDNPKEIGADLIADIIGANKIYGCPSLIVDLGTVNKFLHVNERGIFNGCSFFPGMQSSLSLFNEKTALLPEVSEFQKAKKDLSKNTIDAMNHGVYWSVIYFIQKEFEIFKDTKLILTGGNSQVIEGEFKNKIFDPNLTLKGMNFIFMELNYEF